MTLIVASLGLAACAGDNDQPEPPAPRAVATLFISPAGKPFHGRADQPYPVSAWFAEANAGHDGKLTREEFRKDFEAFFKQIDTDHNGVIDGLELTAYEQNVAPEVLPRLAQNPGNFGGDRQGAGSGGPSPDGQAPGGQGGGRRRHGGGEGEGGNGAGPQVQATTRRGPLYDGAPQFSLLNISEPISGADADFDGRVTLEEFLAAADRRFDMLDPDHRGYLTLDALPKTPQQKAVERQRKTAP